MVRGAQHEGERLVTLRQQMQAAQRAEIAVGMATGGQPADHRAEVTRAQRLLDRPQALARRGRLDEDRAREIEAGGGQCRRIRHACASSAEMRAYGGRGGPPAVPTPSQRRACASCASAGASSDNSPMPASSVSSSTSCPCGQPPPGSSRSSSAKPLASVGPQASSTGRSSARHSGAPTAVCNRESNSVAARMCVLLRQ